jgi:hypothetical protein
MSRWKNLPNGKTVKRGSLRIDGQFAPRCIDMLESPAYRVLNLAEHRILARLEIELAHHGGLENGKLVVTYGQFAAYGVRFHSIAPAIRSVDALGFVRVKPGRGGNSEFYQPNRFLLTYRKIQFVRYGDVIEASNEWRRIKTLDEARQIAKAARAEKTKTSSRKRKAAQSKKIETRPTKRGAALPHETGGGNDLFPPHETGGPSTLTKRGVHSRVSGGGGDGGGISNPIPLGPSAFAGRERSAPVSSAVASERPATALVTSLTKTSSAGNERFH